MSNANYSCNLQKFLVGIRIMKRFLKWGMILLGIAILVVAIAAFVFKSWAENQRRVRREKIEILRNFPVPEGVEFFRMQESGVPDSAPTTMIEYNSDLGKKETYDFYQDLIGKEPNWIVKHSKCDIDKAGACGISVKIPDLKNDVTSYYLRWR